MLLFPVVLRRVTEGRLLLKATLMHRAVQPHFVFML